MNVLLNLLIIFSNGTRLCITTAEKFDLGPERRREKKKQTEQFAGIIVLNKLEREDNTTDETVSDT